LPIFSPIVTTIRFHKTSPAICQLTAVVRVPGKKLVAMPQSTTAYVGGNDLVQLIQQPDDPQAIKPITAS
jgi:hypothetical protein